MFHIATSLMLAILLIELPAVAAFTSSHARSPVLTYGQSYIEAETGISQTESGNGCFAATAITINNPGDLASAIEDYILANQPDSPFATMGSSLVSGAEQDNVNPLLLVGIMEKESMFGTVWGSSSPRTHNAFGRKSEEGQPTVNGWYRYNSWEESLNGGQGFDDIPNYIRRVYIEGRRAVPVKDFIHEYDPAANNSDVELYTKQIRQTIESLIERAGSSVSCGSGKNWRWPLESGGRVISCTGSRTAPNPIGPNNHTGIDIAEKESAPVLAANSGEVITARHDSSAGLLVEIRHTNSLVTRYLHNTDILVNVGETVSAGQRIAHVGTTGNAVRPFLHFEIIRDRQHVNPLKKTSARGDTVFAGDNCTSGNTGGQL